MHTAQMNENQSMIITMIIAIYDILAPHAVKTDMRM